MLPVKVGFWSHLLHDAAPCLPDSVDDHEHLAEHLEDVGEGQEGDVGVAVRAEDVDRERERLQRVEQVPLREHHALRNTCLGRLEQDGQML